MRINHTFHACSELLVTLHLSYAYATNIYESKYVNKFRKKKTTMKFQPISASISETMLLLFWYSGVIRCLTQSLNMNICDIQNAKTLVNLTSQACENRSQTH